MCRNSGQIPRKYTLNHDAFNVLTPESAYWIGFIMADGCVVSDPAKTGVQIRLCEIDREHLEKCRRFLGTDAPIRTYDPRHAGFCGRPQVHLAVHSRPIAASLAKYGVVPRKTKIARVIGLEANRDFWRGVFDGDGFIVFDPRKQNNYPSAGIVGARPLMKQFAAFVRSVCGRTPKLTSMNSIWSVRVHGKYAQTLLHYLYDNATVELDRKRASAMRVFACHIMRRSDLEHRAILSRAHKGLPWSPLRRARHEARKLACA